MNTIKIIAIALIIAGGLALAYGGFSYTRESQQAKVGPVELTLNERQWVGVPVWAGMAAIAVGVLLLAVPRRG